MFDGVELAGSSPRFFQEFKNNVVEFGGMFDLREMTAPIEQLCPARRQPRFENPGVIDRQKSVLAPPHNQGRLLHRSHGGVELLELRARKAAERQETSQSPQ